MKNNDTKSASNDTNPSGSKSRNPSREGSGSSDHQGSATGSATSYLPDDYPEAFASTKLESSGDAGEDLYDARRLYDFLEERQPFHLWIGKERRHHSLVEGVDFGLIENEKGTERNYWLTRSLASRIVMRSSNARGNQARRHILNEIDKFDDILIDGLMSGLSITAEERSRLHLRIQMIRLRALTRSALGEDANVNDIPF